VPQSRNETLSGLWIAAGKNQADLGLVREYQNSILSYAKARNVQSNSGPKTCDFWQARDQLLSVTATIRANKALDEETEILDFFEAQTVAQTERTRAPRHSFIQVSV
jgi:hypothetical protein